MFLQLYEAIATIVGMIIGAGILAIPYVFAQSGILTGMLVLVAIGLAILFLNLALGEIVLRTPGNHQLPGYARTYLGIPGKVLMLLAMIIGNYGALLAYVIGEGQSLAQIFGGQSWLWSFIFWAAASLLIFKGLKAVERSELALTTAKILIFAVILFILFGAPSFSLESLATFDAGKIFIPYGVIFFAFLGAASIPEAREELRGKWKHLQKAIFIGSLIPIIVYALFALAVVGVTGMGTTEVANIGVGQMLGVLPLILINLFAIIAMATSFIAIGLALKEAYTYDLGIPSTVAWILTCVVPFALFIVGVQSFIGVIGVAGALAGGIEGILIVLMVNKARKHGLRQPEYKAPFPLWLGILLIILFVIGALTQVVGGVVV